MDIPIHGFSDASERAYGACIYISSIDRNKRICIRLICSKSRVELVYSLTLPRLEFDSAFILARLYNTVKKGFLMRKQK